ncbi:Na+/H+ antiporter NhaA [Asticcacaulis sp. EMRT-3]|uniref:Na+/H+ antiporter NhaA n=1 Tax=Asticcacaulis sp. EMRT-3 TaxID=3040349 RepID=UPI0024AF87BF|nr:Na+/H+ antiporter NhaA [Asticcacaulis sp. EMRT-3]MDI7775052.1 Na+/H+ antiporter NhaA [Asticcacaulis sp. EMRT-3]
MRAPAPLNRFTLDFLKTEAGSGTILALCAVIALVWANSPWAEYYFSFIHYHIDINVGAWRFNESVLEWTKEGLMAIFFFVVGLEIKYEIVRGALSSPRKLALPVIAAIGGMAVPALIYLGLNIVDGGDLRGWSVPTATDIAFALAVLAMAGKSLPSSLRVFLLTLAIVDDLGAVIIIGVFYNAQFNLLFVAIVLALLAGMASLKYLFPRTRIGFSMIYMVFFVAIWAMSLEAGLSPSLTAVAAAFCVSIDPCHPGEEGMVKWIASELHPYVAWLILPFFAFTASGFSLEGMGLANLIDPRFLGVMLGLFVGKQVGVFAASQLAISSGLARLPDGATAGQVYAVCLLCGIGFTMSLFMAALAFRGAEEGLVAVKAGVIVGSLLSAAGGAGLLTWLSRKV